MLDKFLEEYIDKLYINSNINMQEEQKNLYTKSDYYNLLKPVITLIKNNKDNTLNELREKLLEESELISLTKDFVLQKELVPGLVFTYGTNKFRETIVIGNRQEVALSDDNRLIPSVFNMTEDTIFDLASVTKIYTSLSIYKLVSMGLVDLNKEIISYDNRFKNLKGVTVFDLLTFKTPLKTTKRVDLASNIYEANNILFNIEINHEFSKNANPYTDMGCMVLKYIIEKVTGISFYEFVDKFILKELNMSDTNIVVPNYKLDRTASTIGGVKYFKDGNFNIDKLSRVGIPHDPKAKVFGEDLELPGHAGLFSTASDMSRLAKGIINNIIIDEKYITEMTKNRTGRVYKENGEDKYVQYLGSLCYSKHPRLSDSELFHAMSGKSFGSGGFTGTQFTVDPINEIYFFLGGNRVHNRLVYIDPSRKDELITLENGKRILKLPNGEYITDATRYAWERDKIVHASLSLSIKYKMLEDFYALTKEKIEEKESVKYL